MDMCKGADLLGHERDLMKLIDGDVPHSLMRTVEKIYKDVQKFSSWMHWFVRV